MKLSAFDFDLPPEQIAQHPAQSRDQSRLLVISKNKPLEHLRFAQVTSLFKPGDLLIRNDTKVIPARLIGRRETGGRIELLLLEPKDTDTNRWLAIGRPARVLKPGTQLAFGPLNALVLEKDAKGNITVEFDCPPTEFERLIDQVGRTPLPPYIHRTDQEDPAVLAQDRERYQTVYAARPGAVAAPTAGLHFTDEILAQLRGQGVEIRDLTLHVGAGTFLPIRVDDIDRHQMHSERFDLPAETADAIARCRRRGGRLVAVGTTATRVLETLANDDGTVKPGRGRTEMFIKPGHRWRAVDVLLTNFHLPKGTLLVLVCALAGTERLLAAYQEAVARGYRFFSYGDACWIERA